MAQVANVVSHWDQLIENFQTSSLEFYNAVEQAVTNRAVPETHWSRIEHKEGGLASANRQYLRMHRGKYAFDICAAPFGNGFFVSWWLTEPPLRFAILYTLGFLFGLMIAMNIAFTVGFGIGTVIQGYFFGVLFGGGCAVFGVPALLWLIGNGMRNGNVSGESTVLAMPLIGPIYERIFAPPTFYAIDTVLMFQESVHNAVLEVIDFMTTSKGVQALTESERKPVLKSFAASV